MAIVANTWLTFDSKGNREDLSNVIYNISPEDTPLLSMMPKRMAKATNFEWQTDALAAAATNAAVEGDDVSFTQVVATARVGNYTQISNKTFIVSGTQEVIDKAGRKSEVAYQVAKQGKELKRDMEYILFAAQAGAGGSSSVARTTAALNAWIKTNDTVGTNGLSPTYTSGVPAAVRTDGTQRAFTETILKDTAALVWNTGGELRFLFLGSFNKAAASAFSGIAPPRYMTESDKQVAIIGAADVYRSDFGLLKILPHRFQRARDGWLIDPAYLKLAHLRPFKVVKLAKTGDAEKRMLIVEWGLQVDAEGAQGLCADLTTS